MTEELSLTGKCMCGAVNVTASARKPSVAVCHCEMCRRRISAFARLSGSSLSSAIPQAR